MEEMTDIEALTLANYASLKEVHDTITKALEANEKDTERIKSGKLSELGIRELQASITNRERSIHDAKRDIEATLQARIDSFVKDNTPAINPSELTEDTKLLNCGVKLNSSDVMTLLERNKGNYTMTTLLLRYCEENNISLDNGVGASYMMQIGVNSIRDYADSERCRINYAIKYLGMKNGIDTIKKFYGVG